MEKATLSSTEIPTALPGFEDDDAREKLLLENSPDDLEDPADEESAVVEESASKPRKRLRQVAKTFAAFAVFICLLVVGIGWFFGMGWFSRPKAQAVNRTGKQESPANPAAGDEKLKMALSLVAPSASVTAAQTSVPPPSEDLAETPDVPDLKAETGNGLPKTRADQVSFLLPPAAETPTSKAAPFEPSKAAEPESEKRSLSSRVNSDDARGRSLFFGISKKQAKEDEVPKPAKSANSTNQTDAAKPELHRSSQIPFGTLLPVRLVGSIYTLRNSGGHVRMELTRPVEGDGYSYPAGTLIVGEVRGGESVRAFVNVVGLIDPVSDEFVKFNGELLGRDGASGIEGRRRNLTSQWSRFFRGVKDTAASVLGSVGALRSGGTVILSESIRRGTESMSEDLSGAVLKNDRQDTFLEVAAGSSGYVLVTGLPENSTSTASKPIPEAAKE
ncbi:MAG: hypothetical protein AB7F88_00435 [Pyrinomonadaceae bacterium]